MMQVEKNWAQNLTYSTTEVAYPTTVAEAQRLVADAAQVKALGSRHSFSDVADTTGLLISLERLEQDLVIDRERQTVTIAAGMRYGAFCQQLHEAGFAIPNMASLPHITVIGACATGTHGSGTALGGLGTAVSGLQLVTATGDLVALSREANGEQFAGAIVALGGLGVVTQMTLDIIPSFTLCQDIYRDLPLAVVEQNFAAIMGSGYSVSLFTNWQQEGFHQVWVKRPALNDAAPATNFFGAQAATEPVHPGARATALAANCTGQLGVPGHWHERLPHFRMEAMPSIGAELQTEYLLPFDDAVPALQALAAMRQQIAEVLLTAEVRTVAADDLWLSPAYQQCSVALHFTWKPDWPAVSQLLPQIEQALALFGARPHWGKLFTIAPATVQGLYPRLPDFQALLQQYDPLGKFRNRFLDRYIFGA